MYISVNGQLIETHKASIAVDSPGFLYGYGLFETIKFHDEKIYFLREHYDRLKKDCQMVMLNFDYSFPQIKGYCEELITKHPLKAGGLKILYGKNNEKNYLIISLRESNYHKKVYRRGFKLCFTEVLRNPHSPLTFIKSNNYLENLLVKKQALDRGYDEALFINFHGDLCEGTLSNLFFVKDNIIYTPKIECGILAGIMRGKIIEVAKNEAITLKEGTYKKEALLDADEVFLSNSLIEIMPVFQVENRKYNMEENHVTRNLIIKLKKYTDEKKEGF